DLVEADGAVEHGGLSAQLSGRADEDRDAALQNHDLGREVEHDIDVLLDQHAADPGLVGEAADGLPQVLAPPRPQALPGVPRPAQGLPGARRAAGSWAR